MGGSSAPRSAKQGADTIAWLSYTPINQLENVKFWRDRKKIEW
jgi:hypothetical protein